MHFIALVGGWINSLAMIPINGVMFVIIVINVVSIL